MYKLLIVDDEPMTRDYIKNKIGALHQAWVCAGEAGDGQEALDLMERGETFDLIVTDIKMPVMNGIELAKELSGRPVKPRMVILSGYDEFALAKEAMRYGVNEYMLKPLVNEELIAVLDRMAAELDSERAELAASHALSEQSREQVARNFLHAVVTDNHMELKVLHPLLYRLKINLLEAEGAILLVDLDEGQLVERGITPSDQALFRYIVHQTAAELTEDDPGIVLFADHQQRTALLVPGDNGDDVARRCADLYARLAQAVLSMTGLGLWGAAGSAELDALQLGASYRSAGAAMKGRQIAEEHRLLAQADGRGEHEQHETVTKVKKYIQAHYAEPISLALIADKMGMSPGYLSSLFHQNTGESYIKYLTRVRMERAAQLLRAKPPEKVYDVAEKVGYLSVKHFSYVFKQHYGTPPGEFQMHE
ncbi:response regulator [Paenibacillus sp. PAMC21692]|uniref:response regulator n=1 Tax=Paenibacillus sp. PAMC21692 TaxID=2762320 RepID=UPI00164E9F0A|nr:response regulator [Paenibacillus sp. PAMC21692]QNK59977.1 response regulator [Paenibacillus sp. PAMC21692]